MFGKVSAGTITAILTAMAALPGREALADVFKAGDEMSNLLYKVYEYLKARDPKEAEEFEQVARKLVLDYQNAVNRYAASAKDLQSSSTLTKLFRQ